MRYPLPPIGAGWRGLTAIAEQSKPRQRLSDGWWIVCDPEHTRLTVELSGEAAPATLSLAGTIGSAELHVEIAVDPAHLEMPPRSLSFMLAGTGDPPGLLKRIVLRRRGAAGPDAVRHLWRTGTPIAFAADRATVPIDEDSGTAIVALARAAAGNGDQACLILTFATDRIDLRLGDIALDGSPPQAAPDLPMAHGAGAAVDDAQLVAQIRDLVARELPRRLREHLHAKNWVALDRLAGVFEELSGSLARASALVGRGRVQRGEHAAAADAFDLATRLQPEGEEPRLSLALALTRGDALDRGIGELRTVLAYAVSPRARFELARALRRRMRERASPAQLADDRQEAITQLRLLDDADLDGAPRLMLADLLYEQRAHADCLGVLDGGALEAAAEVASLLLRSRALVALDRIDESLEVARRIALLDPDNAAAAFHLRTLRHFGSTAAQAGQGRAIAIVTGEGLAARLAACEADWVLPTDSTEAGEPPGDLPEPKSADGFVAIASPTGKIGLWRRDCLANLVASGLVTPALSGLSGYESLYGPRPAMTPGGGERGATVVLMSRHGSRKFGGGEHFLEGMADHYRSVGLDPLILGTHPDRVGERGTTAAGDRFAFIEPTVPALLRCLVEHDASLIHAISGSGFLAAGAVAHSRIRLIYGIHDWCELLGDEAEQNFFLENDAPNPRLAFGYILSHAEAIYANSPWVRGIVERCFGVRVPVVHSVPADRAA